MTQFPNTLLNAISSQAGMVCRVVGLQGGMVRRVVVLFLISTLFVPIIKLLIVSQMDHGLNWPMRILLTVE